MTPKRMRYIAAVVRDHGMPQAADELDQHAVELEAFMEDRPKRTGPTPIFVQLIRQAETAAARRVLERRGRQ